MIPRILTTTPDSRMTVAHLSDSGREGLTRLDLSNQHPIRFWEYGMALTALEDWIVWDNEAGTHGGLDQPHPGNVPYRYADLGAAGSPFHRMLRCYTNGEISVVDPDLPGNALHGGPTYYVQQTGETFAQLCVAADHRYDAVFIISVLEHHPTPNTLLRAAYDLLRPGGLLFLTVDCWDAQGPDTAHFHWMRKRIYSPESVRDLLDKGRKLGFRQFGQADWAYHGPTVYDYSVMSLAMVRAPLVAAPPLALRVPSDAPTTANTAKEDADVSER